MIYVDTKRNSWRFSLTATRFYGSFLAYLLLGLAVAKPELAILATFVIILKIISEARVLKSTETEEPAWSADLHSARLQLGPLRKIPNARIILAFSSSLAVLVSPRIALPFLILSKIFERQLFFQSCHAPKMPGCFGS